MGYGTYNYSYWGESKPTYNWGASHCGYGLKLNKTGGPEIWVSKIEPQIKVGVPSFLPVSHSEMTMAISYNWLFLWDYTFYKWGYKML